MVLPPSTTLPRKVDDAVLQVMVVPEILADWSAGGIWGCLKVRLDPVWVMVTSPLSLLVSVKIVLHCPSRSRH